MMATHSSHPTRPRTAVETGSRSASTSFSYAPPAPSLQHRSKPGAAPTYTPLHTHTRSNRQSGEIISNLIFSLSPITNKPERLLEKTLPPPEVPPQNPAARSERRAQISDRPRTASSGEAAPFQSPLVKEEAVVTDKHRAKGELATVDEREPSSKSSPTAVSNRQRLKSAPPPIAVPRRSMSLRGTQTPAIMESSSQTNVAAAPAGEANDMFGSVSVMAGRVASPSIISTESVVRRPIIGRSPSRAKSTKQRIKELDAERKKRLSTKNVTRTHNMGASGRPHHSSNLSRSSPAVPRTSNVSSDERASSPARPPFARQYPQSTSRTTSALGISHLPEFDEMDHDAPPLDPVKDKRIGRALIAGARFPIPPRASSKHSTTDFPDDAQANISALLSYQAATRPSKLQTDISKVAVERDEAGTTQRIQELKAQKEERERRDDAHELNSLYNARPPLSEFHPSRAPTRQSNHPDVEESDIELVALALSHNEAIELQTLSGKQTLPQDTFLPPKLGAASMGEPRKSSLQNRTYSNIGNYPRASADVDAYTVADSIDEEVDEYLSDPRLSRKIYHQDSGRCVSYSDVGDPNGFVIICCVGMGTSRFVTAFYDELAQTLGLRLITPERPGIGDSELHLPGEVDTPLGWPDDIRLICQHLNISRFSLLAHSAGSIYALATALRMPANIRGRVHVLAPWIPPSQLMAIGQNEEPVPVAELPLIQRILRSIPEAWLEAATRVFNMSSITSSLGKSPYAKRRRNTMPDGEKRPIRGETPPPPTGEDDDYDNEEVMHSAPASPMPNKHKEKEASRSRSRPRGEPQNFRRAPSAAEVRLAQSHALQSHQHATLELDLDALTAEERIAEYDRRLTGMIWQLATSNANPAVDLMVCLERKQEIGFRYEDITKPVVLHHGTKDTRVSVENVIWLGENMRRCEVRILEGEGHGLMANARVMYSVLSEMAQDWRDWNAVVKGKKGEDW